MHAVGVDRIVAEAGVAKATFYNHFPAKDELVRAYVEQQSEAQRARAAQIPAAAPRDMILAIFDVVAETGQDAAYRGCPFVNAAAEYPDPDHPVREAIADHRRWFRDMLVHLLTSDGHPDPDGTADILIALKDGLLVGADLDRPARESLVRDAVTRVLDARGAKPRTGRAGVAAKQRAGRAGGAARPK